MRSNHTASDLSVCFTSPDFSQAGSCHQHNACRAQQKNSFDVSSIPLPTGWQVGKAPNGKPFFLNHNDFSTHWCHPLLLHHDLPPGWENIEDGDGNIVYYNHKDRVTTRFAPDVRTTDGATHQSALHCPFFALYTCSHILRLAGEGDADTSTVIELDEKRFPWIKALLHDPAEIGPTIAWDSLSAEDIDDVLFQLSQAHLLRLRELQEQDKGFNAMERARKRLKQAREYVCWQGARRKTLI
ncbi:uncharacterized protein MONBRDRAFT_23221 [Monosiga brevicollis MX1]|uniref:WW domain-containing protein n=1 Tax=Monosiga brevicollis TaxID=81824 RepID=A9URJ0_MONBE|nr:uncharacterized protein MONBRDRAFT_23221 [Monosiga brevicollis MX1]EDQ92252.1 predicted protein [Monosiga brevicollis MX1]|eukprot:XP_001743538.1 hypothetical protein [Monosiga brevicollis MX1]